MADIIFESVADQRGFTQLPNIVLEDGSITPQAKTLYALLRMYAWQDDGCYPGQVKLAGHMGVSDRTVRDYMRELEDQMLVSTERRGSTSNRYTLLALGLRAKRMHDRSCASDRDDRSCASDQTGAVLPTKKTQGKNTQIGRERGRAPVVKVSGKPVKKQPWALTDRILTEFNEQTGRDMRLLTSGGEASDAAKRIYLRVLAYTDLTFEDHQRIIRNTLASKWWGDDRPSVGVIYGPRVFEENISRKAIPAGKQAKAAAKDERTKNRLAAMQRVMGGDG
jgi:hypothetical protein